MKNYGAFAITPWSTAQAPLPHHVPNALTVDVEDFFQVSAFDSQIARSEWESFPQRVEKNTEALLALFEEKKVLGTFFVLGWIAHRFPQLVRRIQQAGHELGCHSYWHRLVYQLTPAEFRDDLRQSRDAIQQAAGCQIHCYRSPSFSITQQSLWALEILVEEGFTVDSSIFPMKHDRYGMPDACQEMHTVHTPSGTLTEFPPSVWNARFAKIPIGGGYFRLFPFWLTQHAIRSVRFTGNPGMFYVHPWEIDPDQPRVDGIDWKTRFRHYVGLHHTSSKLNRLLSQEAFAPVSTVLTCLKASIRTSKSSELAVA